MRARISLTLAVLLLLAANVMAVSHQADPPDAKPPLRFTENRGQIVDTDGRVRNDVRFSADCGSARLYFTNRGVSYVFRQNAVSTQTDAAVTTDRHTPDVLAMAIPFPKSASDTRTGEVRLHRVDMDLLGAAAIPRIRFEEELPGYSQYYLPHCPDGITHVKSYSRVVYENVYPSVDLVFMASGQRVKYEYHVHPGGNPADIQMRYRGMESLRLHPGGVLEMASPIGWMQEEAPYTYEEGGSEVYSSYRLHDNDLSFDVGSYNRARTLVIDPWSTFFGGNEKDLATNVETDENGNVYLSGLTGSTSFPATTGAFQSSLAGMTDAFIAKFGANGSLQWSTYYGGSALEDDLPFPTITLDAAGDVYMAGMTESVDFPVTAGAFQTSIGGSTDGFLVKFSPAGTRLWATYVGGSNDDGLCAVAGYGSTGVAVTGFAFSKDFPTTTGAYQPSRSKGRQADAILARFDANGSVVWSTYFGGYDYERGNGLAVDGSGNIVVTGWTISDDFPVTTGAVQGSRAGGADPFLIKFGPTGSLIWGTYFGGTMFDQGDNLDISGNGDIILAGYTCSADFPVTPSAFQSTYGGGYDCFVSRFDAQGLPLWSSYYGGSAFESHASVAVDGSGNVLLAGGTTSLDLPVTAGAMQPSFAGSRDGYATKLTAAGAQVWGTYIGRSAGDNIHDVALDVTGNVILVGETNCIDFPTLNAAQSTFSGVLDGIVMQLDQNGQLPMPYQPPVAVASAQPTSGDAPLLVQFTGVNTSDPGGSHTSFSWVFGDGGSDNTASPSHTYLNAGTYTASLTVTDNLNATASASVTITASTPSTATVRVVAQTVTRVCVQTASNRWEGRDLVVVKDNNGTAVSGAVVTAGYGGPNSGTVSGTTDAGGEVTLVTATLKNPSTTTPWSFTIQDVQASGYSFDVSNSVITAQEILIPKSPADRPGTPEIAIHPNPAVNQTQVKFTLPQAEHVRLIVYDQRGREVATLTEGWLPAGAYSVPFDGSDLPRARYYLRLFAGRETGTVMIVFQ